MILEVRVRPGATRQKIEKLTEGTLKIWVSEPPEGDKANKAVCSLLADYFGVSEGQVKIVGGTKSRHKIVHIDRYLQAT